jgi:hypothetical protein
VLYPFAVAAKAFLKLFSSLKPVNEKQFRVERRRL